MSSNFELYDSIEKVDILNEMVKCTTVYVPFTLPPPVITSRAHLMLVKGLKLFRNA